MLTICRTIAEIPADMRYVKDNDAFFDAKSKLLDTDLVRYIMNQIDGASYVSEIIFCSRNKELGGLNKSCLSTGTKTLLNVINSANVCFDVIECGINVLDLIPKVSLEVNGNIFWKDCYYPFEADCDCDIVYKGKRFNRIFDFMRELMEENENN